ncbi:MAG: hypothetical protein ACI841_005158, partial [Planctomycetota bacterium]
TPPPSSQVRSPSMLRKTLKLGVFGSIAFLLPVILLELAMQSVALLYPSHHVLFLEPDRALGWKHFTQFEWDWQGYHWYAADYDVSIQSNSLGFRDVDREPAKPADTGRVVCLGDSFIEAVQVPFKETSAQVLERNLNAAAQQGNTRYSRWEVLNFGISNYGIGQYLLTWEEHASTFEADYVVIFAARMHMERTLRAREYGAFPVSKGTELRVRPTFRIEGTELVRIPAPDYDKFVKLRADILNEEFRGERSRRRKGALLTAPYTRRKRSMTGVLPPPGLAM